MRETGNQEYTMLSRRLVISIVDFSSFDCEDYHSFISLEGSAQRII